MLARIFPSLIIILVDFIEFVFDFEIQLIYFIKFVNFVRAEHYFTKQMGIRRNLNLRLELYYQDSTRIMINYIHFAIVFINFIKQLIHFIKIVNFIKVKH